ncbi:MAG: 16S rRNA (cytidine(1402)-2'-O)-methyltransferase [bacterium]|nr:16S rRNA (cytidine(1402)-2'-O)-methyltransferase [bacterium]
MSTLYVVATPIGNLEDITVRAVRILKEVDLILCEDTRHTKQLLTRYEIKTPTQSYHQHSSGGKVKTIVEMLESGKNLAMVSDAGTPGINDPGVLLVKELVTQMDGNINIVPIPGASAVITALCVSGFPSHEFSYLGFVPHKKGRQTIFQTIAQSETTTVFYESSHRIMKTLDALGSVLEPTRQLIVCRELTKLHETMYRGTCATVIESLKKTSTKGEFVIIIAPRSWG